MTLPPIDPTELTRIFTDDPEPEAPTSWWGIAVLRDLLAVAVIAGCIIIPAIFGGA